MKTLHKSCIIPYLAKDMYNLVANIKSYPDFVPYCGSADILSEQDNVVSAFIEFNFQGIHKKFITENVMEPHNKITMKLVDGPLDTLSGNWEFTPVNETSSKISLNINYTVSGFAYASIFELVIGSVSDKILKSFVTRAHNIYG